MHSLFVSITLFLQCLRVSSAVDHHHASRRQLQVVNQSGEKVSVEWLHPVSGKAIPLGAPTSGEEISFDSFVNHTFVIRADETSVLVSSSSSTNAPTATFQVTEDPRQVVLIKEGLSLETEHIQEPTKSDSITTMCHERAKRTLASKNGVSNDIVMRQLTDCLMQQTAELIVEQNEVLMQERQLRLDLSAASENYTCADPTRETSAAGEIRTWTHEDVERTVHVLHNRKSSQIHMLDDFISEEECAAINHAAEKRLHRGTVADGKGGSRLSEHRKAWQAGIPHNWHIPDDPIAAVSRRLFAYANEATGYNMTRDGQEEIMSIQYYGNGIDDKTPDRYTPHCDGDCASRPHKTGGRVATMVMYCDVPILGGGTNFQNANVFVKPAKGAAAFFSYLNPDTMEMESGFTSHSGCPVYEGVKKIAVQWMRVGVDMENPWDSFDTNTMKRSQVRSLQDEEANK